MNFFGKFIEKDKMELTKDAFERHGFIKVKDAKKKIYATINELEYQFDFETNTIYEIPSKQIKFAICICGGKRLLFINKDFVPLSHTTSPYRTLYTGLMKEPFKFCYPFDKEVIIETKEKDRLKFTIG